MKKHQSLTLFCCIAFISASLFAQNPSFNLNNYKTYLKNHEHTSPPALMAEYRTPLLQTKAENVGSVLFLDTVSNKLSLTTDELELLHQNGFVVSERLSAQSFIDAFARVWHSDLPLFISTDAILHALHRSYDNILKETELKICIPNLGQALDEMTKALPSLKASYPEAEMLKCINDLDVYFTIAKTLLDGKWDGYPQFQENGSRVSLALALIKKEQLDTISFMMDTPREIDFSQFTVRGHYTDKNHPELANYFRTMMWFGRTEFQFSKSVQHGPFIPTDVDIQRQIIDAFLFNELATHTTARSKLDQIDVIITNLVGEQDNITLSNLDNLASEVGLVRANELLDLSRLQYLKNVLVSKSYAIQRINSQILRSDPMDPEQIQPPAAFLPLGQRFMIDGFITGNVVYDKIIKEGKKIFRGLPSSLDVLFALGNNGAAQLLQNELTTYSYAPNISALRYLIDSFDAQHWNGSLYNSWLQAIRTLNIPQKINDIPSTMRTAAFWQQKMNTQLSSWAELRHDNLLYAKQPYTSGGITCSYPSVYVESFPEFYATLSRFAQNAKIFYSQLAQSSGTNLASIINYFDSLAFRTDQLKNIASKERTGQVLDSTEIIFLQEALYLKSVVCGGPIIYGWYPRMYYDNDNRSEKYYNPNVVVADIHTQPTDEFGNPIGKVLHIGTGFPNLGVFILPSNDNTLTAYVGACYSYHEYVSSQFKRLTDEEWPKYLKDGSAQRPDFINSYLADTSGIRRPPGRELLKGSVMYEDRKPSLMFSLNAVDFQNVELDSQRTQTISIFNFGDGELELSNSQIRGIDAASFQIINHVPQVIHPLSDDSIHIQFSPHTLSSKRAELFIQTNDPNNKEVIVSLIGSGYVLNKPQIIVSPMLVDFGSVACDSSLTKTIWISNIGNRPLQLFSWSLTNDTNTTFKILAAPQTVDINQVEALKVEFAPTSIGSFTNILKIESNDPWTPTVSISFQGRSHPPALPKLQLSSSKLDFTNVELGWVKDASLTINNNGNGTLLIPVQQIFGADAQNFSIIIPAKNSIAPNDSSQLTVRFRANSKSSPNALLQIISNDAVSPQVQIPLTARIITGIDQSSNVSTTFSIDQNYPNPFSQLSAISYQLPDKSMVRLRVFDLFGREIITLIDHEIPAGVHNVHVDASQLHSGTYFYRFDAGTFKKMMKMNVVK